MCIPACVRVGRVWELISSSGNASWMGGPGNWECRKLENGLDYRVDEFTK